MRNPIDRPTATRRWAGPHPSARWWVILGWWVVAIMLHLLVWITLAIVLVASGATHAITWVQLAWALGLIAHLLLAARHHGALTTWQPSGWPVGRRGLALGAVATCWASGQLLHLAGADVQTTSGSQGIHDTLHLVVVVLLLVLVMPVLEELLCRGLVLRNLVRSGAGTTAAVLLSSVLFALPHGGWVPIITTFVLGLSLAALVRETGSLVWVVLTHIALNLLVLLQGVLLVPATRELLAGQPTTAVVAWLGLAAGLAWSLALVRTGTLEPGRTGA